MAVQTAEGQVLGGKIFKVPMKFYDLSTDRYSIVTIYHSGSPMEHDAWEIQMLKAQALGKRLSYSREWSETQRYMKRHHPEQESRLVNTITGAWTGTVLDFNDETLNEGITLNEDGSFRGARIVLGRQQGIFLPRESAYLNELDEKYMRLVAHLYGVKDPKRELPDAYLLVNPQANKDGRIPVVRGDPSTSLMRSRMSDLVARIVTTVAIYDTTAEKVAWLVDENRPDNAITPAEYAELERKLIEYPVLIE